MTIKKLCDWCGTEIKADKNARLVVPEKSGEVEYDMCEGCKKRLLKAKGLIGGFSRIETAKKSLFG